MVPPILGSCVNSLAAKIWTFLSDQGKLLYGIKLSYLHMCKTIPFRTCVWA